MIIKEIKKLNNDEYNLVGVITTPSNDHFTGIIIDMSENVGGLKKNLSYNYDSRTNNHKIIEIKNLDQYLNLFNPYIVLYKKKILLIYYGI